VPGYLEKGRIRFVLLLRAVFSWCYEKNTNNYNDGRLNMKSPATSRKIAFGCSILAAIAIAFIFITLNAIDKVLPCDQMLLAEATSPNGAYTATVISRNCGGASSSDNYMVIVRPTSEKFEEDEKFNDGNDVVFGASHIRIEKLVWRSKSHLIVALSSNDNKDFPELSSEDIYKKLTVSGKVKVSYTRW
jgi:hypothetical protein